MNFFPQRRTELCPIINMIASGVKINCSTLLFSLLISCKLKITFSKTNKSALNGKKKALSLNQTGQYNVFASIAISLSASEITHCKWYAQFLQMCFKCIKCQDWHNSLLASKSISISLPFTSFCFTLQYCLKFHCHLDHYHHQTQHKVRSCRSEGG